MEIPYPSLHLQARRSVFREKIGLRRRAGFEYSPKPATVAALLSIESREQIIFRNRPAIDDTNFEYQALPLRSLNS